jgi:hypothetical protein
MNWINTITSNPNQSMTLKLDTGAAVALTLMYSESQKGWFFSTTYGTMAFNNKRIVTGVNMLRGFRNILPFGFACITTDGYEPVFKDDFANGRAALFLLNQADLATVEQMLASAQVTVANG